MSDASATVGGRTARVPAMTGDGAGALFAGGAFRFSRKWLDHGMMTADATPKMAHIKPLFIHHLRRAGSDGGGVETTVAG